VIGDCAVYERGVRRPGRVPLHAAGDAATSTDGFVWIGLQQPTADDLAAVAAEFCLPPLAVEDAVKAHQRPKLELYESTVFVVLKPIAYLEAQERLEVSEIALFVGERFVVTVRHGGSAVLRTVRERLDLGTDDVAAVGPCAVLYQAADLVVDEYERAIAAIEDDIAEIEARSSAPTRATTPSASTA
jgi:magnesium transporter